MLLETQTFQKIHKEAILQGFENAEKDFLTNYALDKNQEVIDRSGSCAIMAFIIGTSTANTQILAAGIYCRTTCYT